MTTSQKIWYTQRLNSNVGSQCNDNCLFKLSTLNYNEYFQMRYDVVGRLGLSPLQKCTIVIRILAYGSPADCLDEYVKIDKCSATRCF